MSLKSQLKAVSPGGPTVVTVGTFDGVHLGHARLLDATVELARETSATSVAITFKHPPRVLLNPEFPAPHLCPLADRRSLILARGIDHVIEVEFDESVRNIDADEFARVLMVELDMKGIVLGPGATVGRNRGGDESRMNALSEQMGFTLRVVPPAIVNGNVVRSTAIRAILSAGDVTSAAEMLGRTFSISGIVTEGDRRGRKLGFPTANITPDPKGALPADGIYATFVTLGTPDPRGASGGQNREGEDRHMAATNVGIRPTFDGGPRLIEAYLLDFEGDLYGRRITVEFVERLREEVRFETVEALIDQMNIDVTDTRRILDAAGNKSGTR
ncbi:MAG: bifunctional riboflavin kinase/FMN adenylyltransferase [Chloroflexi bacterium]|nr:bifunctional riboflavin kinase/FMN adenylyltransferase [Chloroflexota bacterium]